MKNVKVFFKNGDTITTSINGTEDEIKSYYRIGRLFNIGNGGNDNMQPITNLQFIYPCSHCHSNHVTIEFDICHACDQKAYAAMDEMEANA